MKLPYEEFDLSGVRTYPLASRAGKVTLADFAQPHHAGDGIQGFVSRLPRQLAGADFRAVIDAVLAANRGSRPIVWGIGAHVIKTGLTPILIDLMQRGLVSALATNGAGLIHDFEIALAGSTSEDVEAALGPGRFGMAHETGAELNRAIADGVHRGLGLGQSVGAYLLEASGAAIGEGSLHDFRFFASAVAALEGGVYLNCGSAVVLPEVFLKAVALARNAGRSLDGLTTVNIDFIRHYRPQLNVVTRPTSGVGRGYHLTGHHELLIPLLAAAIVEGLVP